MSGEREAIVDWLRGLHWTHRYKQAATLFADAIERGDHLARPAKEDE